MTLDDAGAMQHFGTGGAGVLVRLALCKDMIDTRKRYDTPQESPGDKIRADALVSRRIRAIRAQLLPAWRDDGGESLADMLLVPSQGRAKLSELLDLAASASDGQRIAGGLLAIDLVDMLNKFEASELNMGLIKSRKPFTEVLDRAHALLPEPNPEDPEFIREHAFAKPLVHESIEAGRLPQTLVENAYDATISEAMPLELVDPELYQKYLAGYLKSAAFLGEWNATLQGMRAGPKRHRQSFAKKRERLAPKFEAIRAELQPMERELHRKRAEISAQNTEKGQIAREKMRAAIDELVSASDITEPVASAWADDQIITRDAAERLEAMGYPVAQVRRDMAEFYRFTRGRVEKLRIVTDGRDRAAANLGNHGEPGVIYLGNAFSKQVLWHEMGHHIEADPAAAAAARAYIRMKSTSPEPERLEDLTGSQIYAVNNEIAYPDHFFSPYVGRVYAHGQTEVFSMALETFSDPALLGLRIKTDPQTLQFALGYIRSPKSTLQALHQAMRQSARQTKEGAAEEVQKDTAQRIKALASSAHFFADTSHEWAVKHGAFEHISTHGGQAVGYVVEQGVEVRISLGKLTNPYTKRKTGGIILWAVQPETMPGHIPIKIVGCGMITKDLEIAKVGAILWARAMVKNPNARGPSLYAIQAGDF